MRGKLWFLGGMAAGFVLGARAGREKYEEIVKAAQKVKEHPVVQETAGTIQDQATKLYSTSRNMVNDKVAGSRLAQTKFGERLMAAAGSDRVPGTSAPAEGDPLVAEDLTTVDHTVTASAAVPGTAVTDKSTSH